MIKERNKTRAQKQRKIPAAKRRKLDERNYEPRQDKDIPDMEEEEKRKESKKNQQRPPQQKDKIKVQPETSGRS